MKIGGFKVLSKDVFNSEIERLNIEYRDRGFKMTKERATQWYSFMKNMSNSDFKKKVDACLMTCRRVPTMADVLGLKESDTFEPANAGAYEYV